MNYAQMAEGFIQIPKEKWDAVQAELTALREKYSTKCEPCWGSGSLVTEFADHTMAQGCPKCHGTGRVMMLDAEGVKAERDNHSTTGRCYCDNTDNHSMCDALEEAFNLVLKGGKQ
jgi:hypothetical protein